MLESQDLHLFNEGKHRRLWEKLGAHPGLEAGRPGTQFAVWAPNAERVEVIGDFNGWGAAPTSLHPVQASGIWQGFVPDVGKGALYKYRIHSRHNGYRVDKADPVGFLHETPPKTASVVWDLEYAWNDAQWLAQAAERNALAAPMSIYEVHLGSWMRNAEGQSLSYRELAPRLADYASRMGFTHLELMPVMEHPFYGSWGYQVTGYFAPTSRYGTPQDLMYLIDVLHQRGIGVILDWVPSHFPNDEHGLAYFDGTHLYEHSDPRQGFHPDWKSAIFNYGRDEVRGFLTASALFWLQVFHADGLRVDGVASMLYLDYSREEGEWIPNRYGGRENIEAIDLVRHVNAVCYAEHPHVQMIAEESTAWAGVSRPVDVGGLGFGLKWDMGWMHDTLHYFQRDPIYRSHHHNELTFRAVYALNENFLLPLSHDEVVHGKGSLLSKMPGDSWQQFANLRLLYGYMWATPGKKLLFMGGEFGQWDEWRHDHSLDWHLAEYDRHAHVQALITRLNELYRSYPALYRNDFEAAGFEWVKLHDHDNSVLAFLRCAGAADARILVVCNLTPVVREGYTLGVPMPGRWEEVFNSDAKEFGGSGVVNPSVEATPGDFEGRPYSLALTLPPLATLFLRSSA
jgi:1,4-alpha-glucan branching enzyme